MSKTMTDDAIVHTDRANMALSAGGASSRAPRPALDQTLIQGDCDHTNLNAAGNRCLSCGVWAHELVPGSLTK